MTLLALDTFKALFVAPLRWGLILRQMLELGARSQSVVIVTGAFTGAVFAAQTYFPVSHPGHGVGRRRAVVSVSMCRELGPVLTGLMLAGRVGAAMSAEIGSMKVTEQIDALRALAVYPVDYLVVPRAVAMLVSVPLLAGECIFFGIAAGYFVGVRVLDIQGPYYMENTIKYMHARDVGMGLVQGVVFGMLIVFVSCYEGLNARDGAVGVGRATTEAVVVGSLAILVSNFFLTMFLNIFSREASESWSESRSRDGSAPCFCLHAAFPRPPPSTVPGRPRSDQTPRRAGNPARRRSGGRRRADDRHHRAFGRGQERVPQTPHRPAAPRRGEILVEGENIVGLSERRLAPVRRKVGILFQHGALFDSMSVEDNVAFPLRESGERDRHEIAGAVREALDVVSLDGQQKKMPVDLSGGMKKRVALARAVITRPRCILYDEPTAGLDPVVSDSINRLIRDLQRRFAVTSVVVTHDMKSAFDVGDRIAYLKHGPHRFRGNIGGVANIPTTLIFKISSSAAAASWKLEARAGGSRRPRHENEVLCRRPRADRPPCSPPPSARQEPAALTVHEWGTFTSLQDENGRAMGGINTDDEPVPSFVHDVAGMLLIKPTEIPTTFSKGAVNCHPDVTMRLETPVLYFHAPAGAWKVARWTYTSASRAGG